MSYPELSERNQQVLKNLIERYVADGQPVGSKTLSEGAGLTLSSASIRNVMSELEELGLVCSPHTSAGRIPTVQGYRFFVDALITMEPPELAAVSHLEGMLDATMGAEQLVASASQVLSQLAMQAGLVTLPLREEPRLTQLEFIPLAGGGVLVVLVVNDKEVQNRIIYPARPLREEELRQAANFINAHYVGRSLSQVHRALVADMQADKDHLNSLMQTAIDLATQAIPQEARKDYRLTGESHLIDSESPGDMGRLKELFQAFEQKQDILELLERSLQAEGTQIFIGEESGFQVLDDFSVITTPYEVGGNKVGVLGVIGPTRMAYDRVIPMVNITARILSAALEHSQK